MRPMLTKTRKQFIAFILLAFVMQAMIPAGFMPGTDNDGKMKIVICSGNGFVTKLVDIDQLPANEDDTGQGTDHDHESSHSTCPYTFVISKGMHGVIPMYLPLLNGTNNVASFPVITALQAISQKSYEAQGPPAILS